MVTIDLSSHNEPRRIITKEEEAKAVGFLLNLFEIKLVIFLLKHIRARLSVLVSYNSFFFFFFFF